MMVGSTFKVGAWASVCVNKSSGIIMPLEAERCDLKSNGSRDQSRCCKALSWSKGWISFIQGVSSHSPNIGGGGAWVTKPQDRVLELPKCWIRWRSLWILPYHSMLWANCWACGWMKMGRVAPESTRNMNAHLRHRRPPKISYLWGVRGDCSWTMGSTWVHPSLIFSPWFPSGAHGMTSGGQSTRVGIVTDLRVRKEHSWDLILPYRPLPGAGGLDHLVYSWSSGYCLVV